MKTKQCSICNKEVPKLWRSNPKTCYYCARGVAKNTLLPERGSDTNQKKKSRLKPISKGRIKKCSDKQAERLKEYRIVRDKYLKENPTCARCGTTNNLSLHHLAGREGKLLTDVNNFMTLCIPCHSWASEFTKDAIEQGFARSRLQKKRGR